jgi:hypothetical protein
MPFDPYIQKALLDWCTGAAAVTRPTARFFGFESGSPVFSADSAAPVFRSTASFQAASTIVGGASVSATMLAAISCSASTTCTVFGWGLYASTSGGSRLMYGTLTSTHSLLVGSQAGITAPNLIITLA